MKTIVLGGDGAIGRALARSLQATGHEVVATSRQPDANAQGLWPLNFEHGDLEKTPLPQGDVAFFCAAMTKFADCRVHPVRAQQINVTGPAVVARRLVEQRTNVVLLSTSAVFDWSMPLSPAERPPCPLTFYGEMKAEAERRFAQLGSHASILRLSKVLTPDYGLVRGWIKALSGGQRVTAFSDLYMAPIALADALISLETIAHNSEGGIYQFSAASDITYFDAARHIAMRLGVDPGLVTDAQAADAGIPAEELVHYSSLDASRLAAINGRSAPNPFYVIDTVFGSTLATEPAASSSRTT